MTWVNFWNSPLEAFLEHVGLPTDRARTRDFLAVAGAIRAGIVEERLTLSDGPACAHGDDVWQWRVAPGVTREHAAAVIQSLMLGASGPDRRNG